MIEDNVLKEAELPTMPARDEVGTAAMEAVECSKKIRRLTFEKGQLFEELRNKMLKHKRNSITVEGVTFVLETKEAEDRVRAVWPK